MRPLPLPDSGRAVAAEQPERWDGADLRALSGTYGEYLLAGLEGVPRALARRRVIVL